MPNRQQGKNNAEASYYYVGIKRNGSSFRDGSQVSVIEHNSSNKNSNNKKSFVVIILIM